MTRRPRVGGRGTRGGQGGGPSSGGPAPQALYGVQAPTTSDFYGTVAQPGGIAGAASGFWVAVLFRVDLQGGAASRALVARFAPTPAGWWIVTSGSNTQLALQATDGSAVAQSSPTYTISASDVGKIMLAVGVHTGSALQLFVNRLQVGTSSPITGFTPHSDRTFIGKRANGLPNTNGILFGSCGGHFVPSLAEIQAQADAVKLAGDIVAIPGKTDSLWSVKQDQAGSPPALLDDKVGTQDMQRTGAPTLHSVTSPVWGW